MQETVISYDETSATLGDRIEVARSAKDMSRQDLADRLGVKKSTIKKWENDQSEPRSNRLYMMAGVLDCNVMWLLNGEGDAPVQTEELDEDVKIQNIKVELKTMNREVEKIAKRMRQLEQML